MILPLVDSHGQTQLVVIDRSTELAREVLTSYFETGTVPLLTPPLIEEPLLPFVPVPPMAEPFVAPLPIFAPVPLVPAPFVAPVHVNPVIVPLEEADAKTKIEQKLKEMQKKAHKAVEKAKKEAKKEKKEIKNTKMEELPARPVVSLPSDELTNEVLLGLDKIKASSVNLAAQLKNTIELHAHDVAKPMLEGLFDIAKTSAKIASHMKDLKTQG